MGLHPKNGKVFTNKAMSDRTYGCYLECPGHQLSSCYGTIHFFAMGCVGGGGGLLGFD